MPELQPHMQHITIGEKKEIYIELSNVNYPSLTFEFLVDSKADVDMEINEILAYVYMENCFMGSIRFNRLDNELGGIQRVSAKGSTRLRLHFTPPKDFLKSPHPKRWKLEGVIDFYKDDYLPSSKKFTTGFFKIKDDQIKTALETYFNDQKMEKLDLEQLKIKPGDSIKAEQLNKIVDAIIEIRKSIIA